MISIPALSMGASTSTSKGNVNKAAMQALGPVPADANDAGTLVSKRAVSTGKPIKGTP